ncbi:VOC family protein [Longispora sp. K20-0274]|uniref:VOC family protein n=1 Tax=Longispora sp. K20-0274 TaxID=3088255 RepID=UPI00399AB1F6
MTIATLSGVTLDCADPAALAAFYTALTGWESVYSSDDYVYLAGDGAVKLGFQRIADHPRSSWPDDAKQFHLEFGVADLAKAEAHALEFGATRPDFQPGDGHWTVLQDPAGHPFCLSPLAS